MFLTLFGGAPRVALVFTLGILASAAALAQPTQPTIIWDPSPNYTSGRSGVTLDAIVIHTTEGSYSGAVSWLKNPSASASAHYVVKEDGSEIKQLVDDANQAWQATYYNKRSIGIECAGYAAQASTWTQGILPALYDLVAWLCYTHNITVIHPSGDAYDYPNDTYDEPGLVAHGQIQPWNRTDPGAYFDWSALVTEVNARLGVVGGGSVVIDNSDPEFQTLSGTWSTGSSASGRYGADYRYATSNGSSSTALAEWRPDLPTTGTWDVSVWYPEGSNRADDAPFTVYHASGSSTVYVNQQTGGGGWVSLGTYSFPSGTSGRVVLDNFASPSVVIADAVQFTLNTAASAPSAPGNLVATVTGADSANLSWDWSTSADGYLVEIAETAADLSGSTGTYRSVDAGLVNTYSWSGLAADTTYYWRATAYNTQGSAQGTPTPDSFTTSSASTSTGGGSGSSGSGGGGSGGGCTASTAGGAWWLCLVLVPLFFAGTALRRREG